MFSVRERNEWKFFGALPKADPLLALEWWALLILRGVLPAAFAISMGVLVGAVQRGDPLSGPLALMGTIFILLQVLTPIHQAVSANLGDRTAAWLYDRLTEACVRPPGMMRGAWNPSGKITQPHKAGASSATKRSAVNCPARRSISAGNFPVVIAASSA